LYNKSQINQVMLGGSKCSTIKEKVECETDGDCVWGKTGKCSVKRKPGAAAAAAASPAAAVMPSPVAAVVPSPVATVMPSPVAAVMPSPVAAVMPSPVRMPSPPVSKTAKKGPKSPKQSKSKSKTKKATEKVSEGPAFSWLEKMGQDSGIAQGMSPVTHQKFRAAFILNGYAHEETGHPCIRIAGVYLEYKSHEVKAADDFSSQKYYCLALFHVSATREFLLIQAWNRIGELPGKNTKTVRASSLEEGEAEFKKVMSDKLKKKYKLAGWDTASPTFIWQISGDLSPRPKASSPKAAEASPRSSAEASPRSSGDEDLVQKTKEDFQPGATLKNVRANGDVDLKGRDMKGIKILGANMVSVDLRGADLSGATLENIMFHNAKLDGANLTGATIRNCGFEDASIKEARFSGARITESDLNKLSSAEKAQFNDSVLTDVFFSGSKFREANFTNAKFEGAETKLNGVSFEKANLAGASFGEGVMLTIPPNMLSARHDRDTSYINFKDANLQKVKFSPNGRIASLAYNNFEGANMTGVKLEEADLRYCKFKGANMTDASLSMADFRDSELSVSALKDAFINGAIFNTLEMHKGVLRFED
jgi:uncharacterized protein YjbI with pentapeptide repeats